MRKKSHVLLAQYLANNNTAMNLQAHRKAFCLGSILPDMKPSFLTTKHEFQGTFPTIQEKICELTTEYHNNPVNDRVYFRRLGEVMHYMADYFTFPHNSTYEGNLSEHCMYEKELKNQLKSYIKSGDADTHASTQMRFRGLNDLFEYIQKAHKEYLQKMRNVAEDIQYIMNICYQVFQGILQIFAKQEQRVAVPVMI
ncbi:MAG: zinc dependent phospholipase C family protein [Lachnospiraceae bacterium]|nr:zinc dependent phospholipase C family protein [Lachnospiraceae bacterium]MDD3616758.1 zinc dependent phospholipase C family protein [Lachnospiraceae bacterium]